MGLIKNIPPNWEIRKMPEVVEWGSGGTPKASVKEYYENGTIPWLIIGDLNNGIITESQTKITELGLNNSSAKIIPQGTLLVAMYGSIGKLGITGMECCTNQAIAYAKKLHGVTTKYMFYYMAMMKSELISKGKGGTQKNISQTVLNSFDVIVPPLEEQRRIVTRIEELFSQLDSGVETLKKTREQLKIYRQAVLKEAFSMAGNNYILLANLIEKPRYGTSKKCEYEENGIAVFRIPNIDYKSGILKKEDLKFAQFSKDELSNIDLKENDILIIRSNGSVSLVGRSAIVRKDDVNSTFAGYLIRVRFIEASETKAKYFHYYLESHQARTYIENTAKSTSGVNNINSNEIKNINIPICDESKMKEIVTEIESRLSVCDSIERTIDTALQEAEALRQSILKQAFEGGLL